jgi:hypothetical protein
VPLPPLFSSRSPALQFVLADIVPAVFGAVCGVMLGISEPAYIVLTLLGILGGYSAGLEHPNGSEGAGRGVVGGFLFGLFILTAHEVSGSDAKADLPEPAVLLVVITTLAGAGLGALGGRSRGKRARRAAGAQA